MAGLTAAPHAARVIAAGLGFTEGPVFMRSGDLAVVSLSHGCVYKIGAGGRADVFVETEASANGLAEGPDGALYIAHYCGTHLTRPGVRSTGGVLRADASGKLDWLTMDPISPNDLCFGPDGLLYVTDPSRPQRQDGRIWRCDVDAGSAELLVSVPWHPNGIGFGPSDDRLFVASTHSREIVTFGFAPGRPLGEPELFCRIPSGKPDGFAFDVQGNLLVACPAMRPDEQSYVHVFGPDGTHRAAYVPAASNRLSNLALSPDRRLVICDVEHSAVLQVDEWPVAGLPLHPFR